MTNICSVNVGLVFAAFVVFLSFDPKLSQFIPPGDAWQECCDETDCKEMSIEVIGGQSVLSEIKAGDFDPVLLDGRKVHQSFNGKEYLCRFHQDKPPSYYNTRCVFVTHRMANSKGGFT